MHLGNDAHVLQYPEGGILKFDQHYRLGCKLTTRRLNDERDGNIDLRDDVRRGQNIIDLRIPGRNCLYKDRFPADDGEKLVMFIPERSKARGGWKLEIHADHINQTPDILHFTVMGAAGFEIYPEILPHVWKPFY